MRANTHRHRIEGSAAITILLFFLLLQPHYPRPLLQIAGTQPALYDSTLHAAFDCAWEGRRRHQPHMLRQHGGIARLLVVCIPNRAAYQHIVT